MSFKPATVDLTYKMDFYLIHCMSLEMLRSFHNIQAGIGRGSVKQQKELSFLSYGWKKKHAMERMALERREQ